MRLRPNIELTGHLVRMLGRLGLHSWNSPWCFMTHGTVIQSVDSDGRTFIIIIIIIIIIITTIHEVALFNRQTATNYIKTAAFCT
jgi:hypothetical protein